MMGYLEGAFDALNDVLKKSVPPNVYRSWTSGARALGELSPGAAIRDVKEESGAMVDAAREGRWLDAGAGPAKMAVAMAGIVPPIRAARVASKAAAPIRGYHGSPHDFAAERLVKLPDGRTEYIVGAPDKLPIVPPRATVIQDFPLGRFRADKVGTGEGNQAYGHGAAYIAENEGVAKEYRQLGEGFSVAGKNYQPGLQSGEAIYNARGLTPGAKREAVWHVNRGYTLEDALDRLTKNSPRDAASLKRAMDSGLIAPASFGKTYEVGIHADPAKFLDWDKPLSGQSSDVRKALSALPLPNTDESAASLYRNFLPDVRYATRRDTSAPFAASDARSHQEALAAAGGDPRNVKIIHTATPAAASRQLRDAGIPGIKYLDQGSRSSGVGSSNYVPFDESIIEILRKYGLIPAAAAGAGAAAVPGLLSPTQEH